MGFVIGVVLVSFGRGALCDLEKSKSFTAAATSAHGASVTLYKLRLPLPVYAMQIVCHHDGIVVGCQGGINEILRPEPATQRRSMQASLFLAMLSLSALATGHFCLLFRGRREEGDLQVPGIIKPQLALNSLCSPACP